MALLAALDFATIELRGEKVVDSTGIPSIVNRTADFPFCRHTGSRQAIQADFMGTQQGLRDYAPALRRLNISVEGLAADRALDPADHSGEVINRKIDRVLDCRRIRGHVAALQKDRTDIRVFRNHILGRLDEFLAALGVVHGHTVARDSGKFRRFLHGLNDQAGRVIHAAARQQFVVKGAGYRAQDANFLVFFQTHPDHRDLDQAGCIYRDVHAVA